MSHPDQSTTKNILLATMSPEDFARLRPNFHRVNLNRGDVLVPANRRVDYIHFPEGGVISTVSDTPGKGRTEVGIIGKEGVSATHLLLGASDTPHESFIQVGEATALRITTDNYLAAIAQSEPLRTMLLRFVQALMIQTAQSAATNAHQRVEARLARWLLMCHDRMDGDEIALTHDFMGMMIAAERSGVTVTLHILEGAGMIRSTRGRVLILDRAKLTDLAGEGYGVPEVQYSRLVAPFGKGS
ncbi:Crp/Fnr family transcriptional regulator [Sphingomonas sp. PsM26]|jgi:CRP-like cAMP-binding protein|nr:Crp/Fnr family transcriptional regulator [Sphingomonas sp. PsM26]